MSGERRADITIRLGMRARVLDKADQSLTRNEVEKALKMLKTEKAVEYDGAEVGYPKMEGNMCSEWLIRNLLCV